MTEIGLQEYCDEIITLIKQGASEEAIAHCQHLLRSFPKFIEAYRLLAEASLDQGDHESAADAFQRVLSADPEDMIAYVGLSMIYEEQGNIDRAVWNMERAFELSPEDMEIRKELQRLYSQRDGTDRSRVKLTPPALGRLYMKGALYQQAIDEFKPLLDQSPDRLDIELSLVEALWRAEKRREAAEGGQKLLAKAPDCLKANLIMAEIWAQAGNDAQLQLSLKAARELDPENLIAQELLKGKLPLQEQSVTVDKLVWAPAAEPERELVDLEEVSLEEADLAEAPDWLTEAFGEPEVEELAAEPVPQQDSAWLDEDREFSLDTLETEELPAELLSSMPPEDASPEELMAWMQRVQGGALAEPAPTAPAPQPEPPPAKEKPAPRRGGAAEMDEEEVSIAALEAEMGVVEPEETEISDEMKVQLESSMPPEDASPEEIMAWLQQSRLTPKPQAWEEAEEEPEEEPFPEVSLEELVWEEEEEEEIDLEAVWGEEVEEEEEEEFLAEPVEEWAWEEEVIGAEISEGELGWEETEVIAEEPEEEFDWEAAGGAEETGEEFIWEEAEPSAGGALIWEEEEEEEVITEEPEEEFVWQEAESAEDLLAEEVTEDAFLGELTWERDEITAPEPLDELAWAEEEGGAEFVGDEIDWEKEDILEEVPVSEPQWEEATELEAEEAGQTWREEDVFAEIPMDELSWEEIKEPVAEPQVAELVWEEEIGAGDELLAAEVAAVDVVPHAYAEKVVAAQNLWEQRRIAEALAQYDDIASSAPELLDTVIADLEEMYQSKPSEPAVGYLLGETYTRANRLAEALELYRGMLANL